MYNAVFCPSFDFYNNVCWYEISTALCVALTLFYWYLQFFATWYLVGLFLQFHYPIVILILPFEYARTCSSVITAYNDTVISLFHGCESFVCYLNSNYVELHNMYTLSLSTLTLRLSTSLRYRFIFYFLFFASFLEPSFNYFIHPSLLAYCTTVVEYPPCSYC